MGLDVLVRPLFVVSNQLGRMLQDVWGTAVVDRQCQLDSAQCLCDGDQTFVAQSHAERVKALVIISHQRDVHAALAVLQDPVTLDSIHILPLVHQHPCTGDRRDRAIAHSAH